MPQYQKRPLIVEAEQFDEKTFRDSELLLNLIRDKANSSEVFFNHTAADGRYYIYDGEGNRITVQNGDYVVESVNKHVFYVCPKDVFEQSYDLVAGEAK